MRFASEIHSVMNFFFNSALFQLVQPAPFFKQHQFYVQIIVSALGKKEFVAFSGCVKLVFVFLFCALLLLSLLANKGTWKASSPCCYFVWRRLASSASPTIEPRITPRVRSPFRPRTGSAWTAIKWFVCQLLHLPSFSPLPLTCVGRTKHHSWYFRCACNVPQDGSDGYSRSTAHGS